MAKRLTLALLVAGLVVAALGTPSSASASDNFYLYNQSSVNLYGHWTGGEPRCLGGAWAKTYGGGYYTIPPNGFGSLELTNGWDPCDSSVPGNEIDGFTGPPDSGDWIFTPTDPGFPWPAMLNCSTEDGHNRVSVEIDGLACTFSDATATLDANFVGSAAVLRHGSASVPVQAFSTTGGASGQFSVALRHHGAVVGHSEVGLGLGTGRDVEVRVDRAIQKRVARRGRMTVGAKLRRVDGKPGTGDKAQITLLRHR